MDSTRLPRCLLAPALLAAALASPACSAPLASAFAMPHATLGPTAADDSGWTHKIAPYVWGAGISGDVATFSGAPPAELDVSFSDILENLDATLMVTGHSRNGDFGIFYDVFWMDLTVDGSTPGPLFDGVEYDMSTLVVTVGPTYRLVDGEHGSVDAVAALRRWDVDNSLKLDGGLLPDAKVSDHESWVAPTVGLAGERQLSEHWGATGWLFGAVGGDSDKSWDAFAGARRATGDGDALVIGYRHLEVDFDDGGFLFDVEISGPIVGWVFPF